MTTTFNPEQFEQMAIEGENQTSFIPTPEGDYQAYVEEYDFVSRDTDDGERVVCNVTWTIPDEALAEQLGLQEIKVGQQLWLDLDDAGRIDFGTNKNVGLGRLRQAVGLNEAGTPFQWGQLMGKQAVISVKQTPKKDDPSIIYSNVARVAHINTAS